MTQDRTALPASLQRRWGLQPQKAPRQGLSLERIVLAAIEVADTEGLDAVSMSRVAKQLGFTTMSLYRHVESKDELLELMTDAAAGEPPDFTVPAGAWRSGLRRYAREMLGLLHERPWISQIPLSGIPTGPKQIAWIEAGLQTLRDTALGYDERFSIIGLIAGFARYEASLSQELMSAFARSGRDEFEAEQDWSRNIAALIDAERFPELSKVLASGTFDPQNAADADPDAMFSFDLERILDGVEFLLREREQGRG